MHSCICIVYVHNDTLQNYFSWRKLRVCSIVLNGRMTISAVAEKSFNYVLLEHVVNKCHIEG